MSPFIFLSADQQEVFDRDGILKIPFLDQGQIAAIEDLYYSLTADREGRNFHSTMFIKDTGYRKEVDLRLREIVTSSIDNLFEQYRLLFANFIVKESGDDTFVGIHQDWNFTSPDIRSINIWIPLVDINGETGLFRALKGSHHTFKNLRYTPYEDDRYRHVEHYILQHSSAYSVRAGEALIYDGALIHFSDANVSPIARIAIGMSFIPSQAPNLHYYKRHSDKRDVEIYEVDEKFYQTFDFLGEPKNVKKIYQVKEYPSVPILKELVDTPALVSPVFKDNKLESLITQKGYVVIDHLLLVSQCDELSTFYETHGLTDDRAFSISNWNNDQPSRDAIFQKICEVVRPYADKELNEYKPVLGVFTAKKPMERSEMLLHQDWSLVDETRYRSVSIWVALCDMDSINGNLQVAEYSHIYASQPRGMNMPIPFENIRGQIQKNHLTEVPLKKGDAIIFDHRLIHASPANKSNNIRLAAVLALIPEEAQLIHCYKQLERDNEIEILELRDADFKKQDFFDIPNKPVHKKSLGIMPITFEQIAIEDILRARQSVITLPD